jgi:hypothetical protein
LIPFWKIITPKRIHIQQKGSSATDTSSHGIKRLWDFLRFKYPLKLDFCRMTINELTRMLDKVIKEDQPDPKSFKPIVAIGHTKDLIDYDTIESFLSYLRQKEIKVSTLEEAYSKCIAGC